MQSKGNSHKWWKGVTRRAGVVTKFIRKRVTSSDGSGTKHVSIVKTYLAPYYKFLTGEIGLNLHPLEAIDEIVYIIESLIKSYFFVENDYCCLVSSVVKKVYS